MLGQEPLSVFRKPVAPEPKKRAIFSAARRLTASRALASISAAVLFGIIVADLVSPAPAKSTVAQEPATIAQWLEVVRPNGAFELPSPQTAALEPLYLTRRHRTGTGREDVIMLGTPADTAGAFVQVSVYRPGTEGAVSSNPLEAVTAVALQSRLAAKLQQPGRAILTKFGELATVEMQIGSGAKARNCLAVTGKFDEPRLGLVLMYCNPGTEIVAAGRVACLLDRLSLASAGRDEKLIDFFAKAERNRSFCDARSTLYGSAPRTPDWINTDAGPVLRGKYSAR